MVIKHEALNRQNDFGISFCGSFLDTVPVLCACNSIQEFMIIDGMRARGRGGTGRD